MQSICLASAAELIPQLLAHPCFQAIFPSLSGPARRHLLAEGCLASPPGLALLLISSLSQCSTICHGTCRLERQGWQRSVRHCHRPAHGRPSFLKDADHFVVLQAGAASLAAGCLALPLGRVPSSRVLTASRVRRGGKCRSTWKTMTLRAWRACVFSFGKAPQSGHEVHCAGWQEINIPPRRAVPFKPKSDGASSACVGLA